MKKKNDLKKFTLCASALIFTSAVGLACFLPSKINNAEAVSTTSSYSEKFALASFEHDNSHKQNVYIEGLLEFDYLIEDNQVTIYTFEYSFTTYIGLDNAAINEVIGDYGYYSNLLNKTFDLGCNISCALSFDLDWQLRETELELNFNNQYYYFYEICPDGVYGNPTYIAPSDAVLYSFNFADFLGAISGASDNSYQEGYNVGYATGENQNFTDNGFAILLQSIFNAPVSMLRGAFNFEIFGVNIFGLISLVLTVGLIIFVISTFKGKN